MCSFDPLSSELGAQAVMGEASLAGSSLGRDILSPMTSGTLQSSYIVLLASGASKGDFLSLSLSL